MVLSDRTIKLLLRSGDLVIEPIGPESIQPASVDFTLGEHFLVLDDHYLSNIDMTQPVKYREFYAQDFYIPAKSFVLATTREYIKLPNNITAFVEGRSSVGRLGLFIQNAGWIDPGFEGKITLELYNASSLPIKVISGRRIGQFVFYRMDDSAERPYSGKYQGQDTTVGSRLHEDKS